jgi:signal peptidase I
MSRSSAQRRRWSPTIFGFVADTYLWIVVCLVLWVALPAMFLGWTPTVITSGSMSPLIQPGDIVLIDTELEPEGYFAPGTILTYGQPDDPNRWTTHRVREITEDGTYVTRGDANRVDDPTAVAPDEVVGAARLVVPLIGLPLQWRAAGEMLPFGVLLALTVIAIWLSTRPVGGPPRPTAPAPVTPEGRVRVRLPRLVPASPYAGLARFSRAVRGPVIGVVALVGLAMSTSVSYTAAAFAAEVASTGNSFSVAADLDPDRPGPRPRPDRRAARAGASGTAWSAGQHRGRAAATRVDHLRLPVGRADPDRRHGRRRARGPWRHPREPAARDLGRAPCRWGHDRIRAPGRGLRGLPGHDLRVADDPDRAGPPLSMVIPADSTIEVIVDVRRVDLRLGGPSVVTLP